MKSLIDSLGETGTLLIHSNKPPSAPHAVHSPEFTRSTIALSGWKRPRLTMAFSFATGIIAVLAVSVFVHAWRLNHMMSTEASQTTKLAGRRLSDEQLLAVKRRVTTQRLDVTALLPPAKPRRYVVVGGSGW